MKTRICARCGASQFKDSYCSQCGLYKGGAKGIITDSTSSFKLDDQSLFIRNRLAMVKNETINKISDKCVVLQKKINEICDKMRVLESMKPHDPELYHQIGGLQRKKWKNFLLKIELERRIEKLLRKNPDDLLLELLET